jgi:hypothetical protein
MKSTVAVGVIKAIEKKDNKKKWIFSNLIFTKNIVYILFIICYNFIIFI